MDFGSSCLTTRLRVLRFGRRAYRPATREIPMESMAGEVADVPAVASAVHERLPLVTPVPLIYPGHSPTVYRHHQVLFAARLRLVHGFGA